MEVSLAAGPSGVSDAGNGAAVAASAQPAASSPHETPAGTAPHQPHHHHGVHVHGRHHRPHHHVAGHHRRRRPPADMAPLRAAMMAALGDAARVNRLLTAGGEEGLTDPQLDRWLAARGWDPVRAARDLAAHAVWRAKLVPQGRVGEEEVANEIAQGKVLLQGPDSRGRAIVCLDGGNHLAGSSPEEQVLFVVYFLDAALAMADPVLNPASRAVGVIDISGFGLKNMDVGGGVNIAKTVQRHYVERLDKLFVYGSNSAFRGLFNLVAPFIDPATRAKVVMLPRAPAEVAAILDAEVGLQHLPPSLGGTAKPRPVAEAWAQVLANRTTRE